MVNPRISSDENQKFDQVVAEMQFSILTGSRSQIFGDVFLRQMLDFMLDSIDHGDQRSLLNDSEFHLLRCEAGF